MIDRCPCHSKPYLTVFAFTLIGLLSIYAGSVSAEPAKVLDDAGLIRSGSKYVIAQEAETIEARKEIAQALRDYKQAEGDFKKAQSKIDKVRSRLVKVDREIASLTKKINDAPNHHIQDRYIPKRDKLIEERDRARKELEQYEQKAQADIDKARVTFIDRIYPWIEKNNAATEIYDSLAKDESI